MLWYALVFQLLNDIHCMAMPHFIHSSVDGHLCCSHLLSVMNNAALNIPAHISVGYTIRVDFLGILSLMLVGNASCFTNWLLQVQL